MRQILDIDDFIDENKDKRFLILDPFMWTPHLETSLEIKDLLEENGCKVSYEIFYLNDDIEDRWDYKRKIYRYFSVKSVYIFLREARSKGWLGLYNSIRRQILAIKSQGELGGYEHEDVNDSIYSSWMSIFKTSIIDEKLYKKYYNKMLKSLDRTAAWIKLNCDHYKPDYIVLFNGRFASVRLIRRFAENNGINFIVHERGSSKERYSLWLNSIPHDPVALNASFEDFVRQSTVSKHDLIEKGREFYEQRRRGMNKGWHSFMSDYRSIELDNLLDLDNREIITYFTSTEDEFKALQQDLPQEGPLAEQIEAIKIVERCCEILGYRFLLRLHPNLATRNKSERLKYSYGNNVIEPEMKISSYELIKHSKAILTHNSQIALEASALGVPAAYTGRTRFEDLNAVVKCRDFSDVYAFIDKSIQTSERIDSVLLFGAYLSEFGVLYRYYRAESLSKGRYNGWDLNSPLGRFA